MGDTISAVIRAYPAESEEHFRSRIQRLAYRLWREGAHVTRCAVVADIHGWRCDLYVLLRATTVPIEG